MPQTRRLRRSSNAESPATDLLIPDKLYFRIGEVSRLTQTKPYVLRYWETEFPTLKPVKTRSGHRHYRREDVEMVSRIKRLLHEERFTIEGARRQLAGNSQASDVKKHPARAAADGTRLKAIRRDLQSILTILSRKC